MTYVIDRYKYGQCLFHETNDQEFDNIYKNKKITKG